MKKRFTVKICLAALTVLFLADCSDLNNPVKDDMEFYMAMTPVGSWEELRREVEEGSGGLIALTRSFSTPAGGAAIQVRREVTICAVDGTQTITRAEGFTDAFFEIDTGAHLTLGFPGRNATLVLDGNNIGNGYADLVHSAVSATNTRLTLENGAELLKTPYRGVFLEYGTMTMNGGTISGNLGGVMLSGSEMIMNGGTISGNGIGVSAIQSSTITINRGSISGNGRGVNLSDSEAIMNGGIISGNVSGGGVYTFINGTMTMNGGIISGNTVLGLEGRGGGVSSSTMIMNGGTISGNTAGENGGGVCINIGGSTPAIFTKNGGTIYGNDAAEKDKNTASADTKGHAVAVFRSSTETIIKYRDTTAGPNDKLDSDTDVGLIIPPPQ